MLDFNENLFSDEIVNEENKKEIQQILEQLASNCQWQEVTYGNYEGENQELIQNAMQFLGYPYVFGTRGPNTFDCSGFVHYVYKITYNIYLPASSQTQSGMGVGVTELKPGDLLFFDGFRGSGVVSHVGIYIGNGQMIHALSPSTGVRIDSVTGGYHAQHFMWARRIVD